MEFISSFFSTPLWHFFDNPLCKNQKIRFIRSTRENIKKRHRNIEKKIRSLASGNVLTQGFFSPERKGKKNSAVSRKRRKRKFLQVSLLKKCKVGVRRDMEKKEKAVFGILVLGKDWRKINVFQVLGDSGMRFWEKKRCDNPVFGRIISDLGTFLGKEES